MEKLGKLLIEKGYSLSSTESFTVGGFASQIGLVPGISTVYKGTLVSYQTVVKEQVLHIKKALLDRYGAVSSQCAEAMCKKGAELFESDICISFTGNAGPLPMEDKPIGLIYIGIVFFNEIFIYEYQLNGSRKEIIDQAIHIGKEKLLELLRKR
ncbi:competence/damage-inducible protein CinA domain [Eggerthia catenaformis OT 569 = DSM 20559]|uniref:Competence/damage-inducible protein CinA domain n=1 Tax=Eggerthia catenaformis OT 569 = DSM 20559 TaxID=999415 RepID=M2NGD0_9FIRM|nr:CinA family protein [Eggerthia catenaformis]EMD17303.1 competence/damage-inducible protein CinA domain [Eggerthia catenaformis OT 569 = DSM 20559]OUC51473.1 damage-inducible protein CinA [Eggerthia catenaformis]